MPASRNSTAASERSYVDPDLDEDAKSTVLLGFPCQVSKLCVQNWLGQINRLGGSFGVLCRPGSKAARLRFGTRAIAQQWIEANREGAQFEIQNELFSGSAKINVKHSRPLDERRRSNGVPRRRLQRRTQGPCHSGRLGLPAPDLRVRRVLRRA